MGGGSTGAQELCVGTTTLDLMECVSVISSVLLGDDDPSGHLIVFNDVIRKPLPPNTRL